MRLNHVLVRTLRVLACWFAMLWLSNHSTFAAGSALSALDADRPNDHYRAAAAAEAATEKVLSQMSTDFLQSGDARVSTNLSLYRSLRPLNTDNAYWTNYSFSSPDNGSTGTSVTNQQPSQYATFAGQFQGLSGYQSIYEIASKAQLASNPGISSTTTQLVALESIPLFEFAIFYNLDLEINPSPNMIINGWVHSNSNLWSIPTSTLVFSNGVTAAGGIYRTNMPGDPSNRGISNPNVIFEDKHTGGSASLYLPIGTNNTPDNVFEILKTPPPGEDPSSPLGSNRFYNRADLIILLSNTTVMVTSGVCVDNQTTTIPTNQWGTFLTTTNSFYNAREFSTVRTVDLDVAKLGIWINSPTNPITARLSGKTALNIVYVADFRTSVGEPGVRLVNGSQIPATGLTVATPNPIYVQGDYNTKDATHNSRSSNNTTYTAPASIVGDAITVLSNNWNDNNAKNSSTTLANRIATDTTVNAAFLGGIVPTGNGYYSGGVENFPRFLENWSAKNFWYNGSMVALFNSRTATAPWAGTSAYYNPPNRKWAFDKNFYDLTKLPPGTPQLRLAERLATTK